MCKLIIIINKWLMVLLSLAVPFSEGQMQNEGSNTIAEECGSIYVDMGVYEKISPSSKYLIYKPLDQGMNTNIGGAKRLCGAADLEVAEVTRVEDIMSLSQGVYSNMWIGLNHRDTKGYFKEGDGTRIRFQSFIGTEPDNNGNAERCVMLQRVDDLLAMVDVSCKQKLAAALCQFKKGTHCFLQSSEELTPRTPDDMQRLGSGDRYFLGLQQKTWNDAHEFCLSKGKHLLLLDDPTNQELCSGIKKRLAEHKWHPATQFWTAGAFGGAHDYVFWQISDSSNSDEAYITPPNSPFTWANASNGRLEPIDQSGSRLETCLDISFENIAFSSGGTYAPLWRASNCVIPKYFICHDHEYAAEIPTTEGPPEEERGEEEEEAEDSSLKCNVSSHTLVNFEINLTKPVDEEDIVKLLIFNIEHDLKSGNVMLEVKESIKWKGEVVDTLVELGKKVVDNDYVDHGLLNVVKLLNLMYLNSASNENDTLNEKVWKSKFIPHLKKCLASADKLELIGMGTSVNWVKYGENQEVSIDVPEELADREDGLDSAIDILWFLFSLSVAQCYKLPSNRITFASDMHINFINDFILPLRQKWIVNVMPDDTPGSQTGLDYTLAFGDVDYDTSYRNLRHVVTAAYIVNEIYDMQLVRPLDGSTTQGINLIPQNAKTGRILFPNQDKN